MKLLLFFNLPKHDLSIRSADHVSTLHNEEIFFITLSSVDNILLLYKNCCYCCFNDKIEKNIFLLSPVISRTTASLLVTNI